MDMFWTSYGHINPRIQNMIGLVDPNLKSEKYYTIDSMLLNLVHWGEAGRSDGNRPICKMRKLALALICPKKDFEPCRELEAKGPTKSKGNGSLHYGIAITNKQIGYRPAD